MASLSANVLALLGDCAIIALGLRENKLHAFILPDGRIDVLYEDDKLFVEAGGQKFEVFLKKV